MSDYVTRTEFETRMRVLEEEVEGEKLLTRHILEQTRRNGDDLAAIKSRLQRVESDVGVLKSDVGVLKSDVGVLKSDVGVLKSDVGSLKSDLAGLRRDLPKIVADAMRDVMKQDRKPRS